MRVLTVPLDLTNARMPMRVLGIDPGVKNIAFALVDLEHASHLTSKVAEPTGPLELFSLAANMLYRERVLEHWIRMFQPEFIFKEGIAHGMIHGVADAGRLHYIVERLGIEYGIPVLTVNNGTMRKYMGAIGGDNSKSDVKLRVWQRYGVEFTSEDECDAFAIAQTGLAILRGDCTVQGKKIKK